MLQPRISRALGAPLTGAGKEPGQTVARRGRAVLTCVDSSEARVHTRTPFAPSAGPVPFSPFSGCNFTARNLTSVPLSAFTWSVLTRSGFPRSVLTRSVLTRSVLNMVTAHRVSTYVVSARMVCVHVLSTYVVSAHMVRSIGSPVLPALYSGTQAQRPPPLFPHSSVQVLLLDLVRGLQRKRAFVRCLVFKWK